MNVNQNNSSAGIKENAKKQFGKQAEAYSKGSIFPDRDHLAEIVRRSGARKRHRVLDVATGAGFLAFEFAGSVESVVGTDITKNMLAYASKTRSSQGFLNTGFLLSDVEYLPFNGQVFDVVSCRFAFHHFPNPVKALLELKRVCKKDGCIVLVDGVSSEDMEKSRFHNELEKRRDPSHVRIYTLTEMKKMMRDAGLLMTDIGHWDVYMEFEDWMKRAGTGEKMADLIKKMMLDGIQDDNTGLRIKIENGKLGFTYDTVIVVCIIDK
jgi:ubiquinone/menaquinone biosynthesis C-methylase UbiE